MAGEQSGGEEQRTSAGATPHEAAHVFRVEHLDGPVVYIAADSMTLGNDDGITRFWVRPGEFRNDLVAIVFPEPGLFVSRVDTLLNPQQLGEGA